MSCYCRDFMEPCYECEKKSKAKRLTSIDKIKLKKYAWRLTQDIVDQETERLAFYLLEKNIDVDLVKYIK